MQENNATTKISQRVRRSLDTGADWVADRKAPIEVATEKTLKLNGISHESAARLVRQQANMFEGTVEAAARRLRTAAEADSLRSLVDGQIKLLPETRDRIVSDIRKTFEILGDTREDLVQLMRETLSDLRADNRNSVEQNIENAADKVTSAVNKAAGKAEDTVNKAAKKAEDAVSH